MQIKGLGIPGINVLIPKKHGDARGFVSETCSERTFAAAGIAIDIGKITSVLGLAAGELA